MAKAPLMLIDFSDAVEINMFTLGQTYSQLMKCIKADLKLNIPLFDPSLLIERFCDKLEFDSEDSSKKRHEVQNLA